MVIRLSAALSGPLYFEGGVLSPKYMAELRSRTYSGSGGVTMTTAVDVSAPGWDGYLRIEYKPRKRVLAEPSIEEALDELTEGYAPEAYIEQAYKALVDEIYTGYAARDQPWEQTPMVLTLEYRTGDIGGEITLGSYL